MAHFIEQEEAQTTVVPEMLPSSAGQAERPLIRVGIRGLSTEDSKHKSPETFGSSDVQHTSSNQPVKEMADSVLRTGELQMSGAELGQEKSDTAGPVHEQPADAGKDSSGRAARDVLDAILEAVVVEERPAAEQRVREVEGMAETPLSTEQTGKETLEQAVPMDVHASEARPRTTSAGDKGLKRLRGLGVPPNTTSRLGRLRDPMHTGSLRRSSEGHRVGSGAHKRALANGFLHAEDELDWRLPPASKRRRTTIGRPQTSRAPGEYVANLIANGRCWEDDKRSLEELVTALKEHFCMPEATATENGVGRILLGQILRSGILAGQPLRVKPVGGDGMEISGHLMESGKVSCECTDCGGDTVRLTEFEEHSGIAQRHLSDNIQLSNHGVSVKDLCNMVNSACGREIPLNGTLQKPQQHPRECQVCKQTGVRMLRCGGGCKARVHPACADFDADYTGPWSCADCMAARTKQAVEKIEEARERSTRRMQKAQEKAAEARRASSRLQDTPKLSQSRRSQGSKPSSIARSKPQRVHMAAPTAKVGLTQGRMVRNSNKHKRLFDPDEPNGVKAGERVEYKTAQGEKLLDGEICVSRSGPCGILCSCCNKVISCSQFEAHAGRGSRRAPYDNIFTMAGVSLRRLAAALPSEAPAFHPEEDEQDAVQEDMLGGCVLCDEKNFQREGFSDLTVILCDQCEREFHVGCLRKHKDMDLQGLPEGDWFCSGKCQEIHAELRKRVLGGQVDIDQNYQWQLMHGKDGSHSTTWALKACYEILQESFDPIIDQVSGQDLVKGMVFSVQQGEWDHTGMFAAILRFKKQPVCALVMRAFGDMLAEVPLIATRMEARRKGHARFLMNALSDLLAEVGVRTLSLPAAHATVETWTQGFGFRPMAADQLLETRESLRLLVFPGTEVLHKVLLPDAEPYPAPKRDMGAAAAEESGPAPGEHPEAAPGDVSTSIEAPSAKEGSAAGVELPGPAGSKPREEEQEVGETAEAMQETEAPEEAPRAERDLSRDRGDDLPAAAAESNAIASHPEGAGDCSELHAGAPSASVGAKLAQETAAHLSLAA